MFHQAATVLKALLATAFVAAPLAASATPFGPGTAGSVTPAVGGGAAWDSSWAHIDSNHPDSPFSGVVSIAYERDGQPMICSGALIGKRSVLSAAHCVDANGRGQVVDLNDPRAQITVNFNSNGTGNASIRASSVSLHANYQGFNVCPNGAPGCVNDDIAVINLSEDAPDSARIYKLANAFNRNQPIILAGYGTSGDGINGYWIPPDYGVKRIGLNYMDLFDPDDEGAPYREVWYADYDGAAMDTICTYAGVCSPVLPDVLESNSGPGDSGGPVFVQMYGELMIAGTMTFGYDPLQLGDGLFGTLFGGMLIGAYDDFLEGASDSGLTFVPEPHGALIFALGAGLLVAARRRRTGK